MPSEAEKIEAELRKPSKPPRPAASFPAMLGMSDAAFKDRLRGCDCGDFLSRVESAETDDQFRKLVAEFNQLMRKSATRESGKAVEDVSGPTKPQNP